MQDDTSLALSDDVRKKALKVGSSHSVESLAIISKLSPKDCRDLLIAATKDNKALLVLQALLNKPGADVDVEESVSNNGIFSNSYTRHTKKIVLGE